MLDKHNPQEYLCSKPVVGLRILQNLKFEQGEWIEGTIYDPENGKEYSCKARLNGGNLDLRGYFSVCLFRDAQPRGGGNSRFYHPYKPSSTAT